MVFANACTRNNLRFVGVRMGIQLRYGSETFCGLSLGLQQSPVELVWPDNFAVFPCLARCKCVSRICCRISFNTFQRHKPHQTERVLTSRTQKTEGEKGALNLFKGTVLGRGKGGDGSYKETGERRVVGVSGPVVRRGL